jgi:hypothetical protein
VWSLAHQHILERMTEMAGSSSGLQAAGSVGGVRQHGDCAAARVPVIVLACSRMFPGRRNEGATGGLSSIWARAAAE